MVNCSFIKFFEILLAKSLACISWRTGWLHVKDYIWYMQWWFIRYSCWGGVVLSHPILDVTHLSIRDSLICTLLRVRSGIATTDIVIKRLLAVHKACPTPSVESYHSSVIIDVVPDRVASTAWTQCLYWTLQLVTSLHQVAMVPSIVTWAPPTQRWVWSPPNQLKPAGTRSNNFMSLAVWSTSLTSINKQVWSLYSQLDVSNILWSLVTAIRFSNDDKTRLACSSQDGNLSVFNLSTDPPSISCTLKGHTHSVNGREFPDMWQSELCLMFCRFWLVNL